MGLELPDLDDRRYADLRETAAALLETHAEEWTDRGAADPGITVVELLAWLTETYGYQLDQVTDDHRRKFLALLGERPRPPASATAVLSVSDTDQSIPAGTPVVARESGEAHRFETAHEVTPTGAGVEEVVVDGSAGRTDATPENDRDGGHYRPFGDDPGPGDALYLGFDADPFRAAETLTLSFEYHDDPLPPAEPGSFEPSVALVWERFADGEWDTLSTVRDGTDALYRGGLVALRRDEERRSGGDSPAGEPATAGRGPPTADRDWLRCRIRRADYEFPPQLAAVRADCVRVRHARRIEGERLLPEDDGALDGQTYAFDHSPVRSATVAVDGEQWSAVRDFDAAGPDDRAYVLDRDAGTVTFGDGRRGAVPPADATVTADYTAGGGTDANVSRDARWTLEPDSVTATVAPRGGATGGRDGETVSEALSRARRAHREPHRAVTAADYREVVSGTPGTRIERVGVVEGGRTTVAVVPYAPPDVARPAPSEGLLDAVRDHLDGRTLLGERVTVRGPRYLTVDVTIAGQRRADAGRDRGTRALSRLVHPVADTGWSFGRPLTPEAVRERLASAGVTDSVDSVSLSPRRGGTDGERVEPGERTLFAVGDVTWRGSD